MSPLSAPHEPIADLAVGTLCRFLRSTFGAQATEEALRRVAAYRGIAERDIANIWANVLQELKRSRN